MFFTYFLCFINLDFFFQCYFCFLQYNIYFSALILSFPILRFNFCEKFKCNHIYPIPCEIDLRGVLTTFYKVIRALVSSKNLHGKVFAHQSPKSLVQHCPFAYVFMSCHVNPCALMWKPIWPKMAHLISKYFKFKCHFVNLFLNYSNVNGENYKNCEVEKLNIIKFG